MSADVVVVGANGEPCTASWAGFDVAVERVAAYLGRQGVGAGDAVVVSGQTSFATIVTVFAAWQRGAAVSIVPSPGRRDRTIVGAEIEDRARTLGARAVLAEPWVWDRLRQVRTMAITCLDERAVLTEAGSASGAADGPGRSRVASALREELPGESVAIYQSTSGTTGEERIVPVTWRMLRHNIAAMAERFELDGSDSFVSWMPLYHDMGLVGYLVMPAMLGARLTVLPPETFAAAPWSYAELLQGRRGTMSGSPPSGIALLERTLERYGPFDLSSLRRLVCGAEMIDVERCEGLLAAGRRHSLRPDVLTFAYGMAEATLAISARTRVIPSEAEDRSCPALLPAVSGDWLRPIGRGLARTGSPLDSVEVRSVDVGSRRRCGDGDVGELEVRGPCVMRSYWRRTPTESGIDEEGWLRTGDLGYSADGEIVLVGRIKDVVKVGGRNIVPEDVERIVGRLPGIRTGRVVAVPYRGRAGEALGVVAERRDEAAVDEQVVRRAVRNELGISPERVAFVARGAVPKTSSGKLRRGAARGLLEVATDVH